MITRRQYFEIASSANGTPMPRELYRALARVIVGRDVTWEELVEAQNRYNPPPKDSGLSGVDDDDLGGDGPFGTHYDED